MSNTSRVLGVDDNPQNLGILRKALGGEFEFISAASGEEAVATARRMRPDVVLLDIMMPGPDGYETCRRMRACPELKGTKILLVSAKALPAERLQGYASGADDYVVKPFDPYELQAKVRVYTRLRSMEEVDQFKTDLLSLFSHETRTPLASILAPLPLLLEGPNLTDEQRQLIGIVESGAQRLMALIEKGFLVAQLKSGVVTLSRGPEDLDYVARSALQRAATHAGTAGVRLELVGGDPPLVDADPVRLAWVLDALLDNAIRFSPPGERVTVRTGACEGGGELSVSDRGPGVAPDVLPRIFREFVVGDVDHHSQGTGLSLATARMIVELHGGTLTFDRRAGDLTTFRIELPAAPAARLPEAV